MIDLPAVSVLILSSVAGWAAGIGFVALMRAVTRRAVARYERERAP